jgi:hypothetical protein
VSAGGVLSADETCGWYSRRLQLGVEAPADGHAATAPIRSAALLRQVRLSKLCLRENMCCPSTNLRMGGSRVTDFPSVMLVDDPPVLCNIYFLSRTDATDAAPTEKK